MLRSGFAAGVAAYLLWGLFPLYWPLLEPSTPVEILAHRVVWSLVVVVLVERLLGAALDGVAQWSPGWLSRTAFGGLTDVEELVRQGVPSGQDALVRLALVTVICLAVAAWRLGSLRVVGRGD